MGGIVFNFRSFFTCLGAANLSKNIFQATYLAEGLGWEVRQNFKGNIQTVASGKQVITGKEFNWKTQISDSNINEHLKIIQLDITWKNKANEPEKSFTTIIYLTKEN